MLLAQSWLKGIRMRYLIILFLLTTTPCFAGPEIFLAAKGSNPPTTPTITATPGDTTNTITLTSGDVGALTNVLYWDTTSRASYNLYANNISNATLVAAGFPGTPYVHTGRTNGIPYYYRLCGTDLAGQTCSSEVSGTPAGGGVTATAYFNCDANTNGTAMTSGTGITAYTEVFTLVSNANCTAAGTPYGFCTGNTTGTAIGNALYRAGGNGYQFQIPTTSNVSPTLGTMTFIWSPSVITTNSVFVEADGGSSPYFELTNPSATALNFIYMSTGFDATATVATGNSYMIMVRWDSANTRMSWRVYNRTTSAWVIGDVSTWVERTDLSGSTPAFAGGAVNFGNLNGQQNNQVFDNIKFYSTYADVDLAAALSTTP